jgi:hypothetical protein
MRCQDVRGSLSLFAEGQLALTEWAIIQTHLQECAECRTDLEGARVRAAELARARRRLLTLRAAGASGVLVVLVAGALALYRSDFRLPSRGTTRSPVAAPPAAPALPAPIAAPAPPAVAAPVPTPVRPQPAPEPPPRVVTPPVTAPRVTAPPVAAPPPLAPAEPVRRVTRPAATSEVPVEERMPTQVRPAAPVAAPPDAEAMPTQGGPRPPRGG